MRYAVDAHAIGRNLTGNEVYVRSLLRAFAAADSESEFLAYVSEPGAESQIPAQFLSKKIASNPFIRLGFDFARKLREDRPALLHVQYTAPLRCPVPTVVTVHDVSFLQHPEYFPWWRAAQLRATVARSIRRASRVTTVSNFTRHAIAEAYQISPDRIAVVPEAGNPFFRIVNRANAVRQVEERFRVREPFILMVGDLQPRKNHVRLVNAFARLIARNPDLRHHLVIAGKPTWFSGKVTEAVR